MSCADVLFCSFEVECLYVFASLLLPDRHDKVHYSQKVIVFDFGVKFMENGLFFLLSLCFIDIIS